MDLATQLRQIEAAIPAVNWTRLDEGVIKRHGGMAATGVGDGIKFLVVAFPIEDQGFPPGSLGYDGTATKDGIVMRLTRPLAEKAWRLAAAAVIG